MIARDPGQIAYEARFTEQERRKRYASEWANLNAEAQELWARVEKACQDAVRLSESISPPIASPPDLDSDEDAFS